MLAPVSSQVVDHVRLGRARSEKVPLRLDTVWCWRVCVFGKGSEGGCDCLSLKVTGNQRRGCATSHMPNISSAVEPMRESSLKHG